MRIGATAWIINSDYPTQNLNPLGDDMKIMKRRYKMQQQIELYKVLKVFKFSNGKTRIIQAQQNQVRIRKKVIKKMKC